MLAQALAGAVVGGAKHTAGGVSLCREDRCREEGRHELQREKLLAWMEGAAV